MLFNAFYCVCLICLKYKGISLQLRYTFTFNEGSRQLNSYSAGPRLRQNCDVVCYRNERESPTTLKRFTKRNRFGNHTNRQKQFRFQIDYMTVSTKHHFAELFAEIQQHLPEKHSDIHAACQSAWHCDISGNRSPTRSLNLLFVTTFASV